jgi:hypothetical protein
LYQAAAVLALLGVLALAPAARAGGKKVRVSVVVILATEGEAKVDPKLACIAREVQKMYPKLKGFHRANFSVKSLEVGVKDSIKLCDGKELGITIQRAADKKNRIQLKVAPPSMGEITYSTPCGKFLPIVTRVRTKSNEQIIIAIRVQPCRGK